jgi:cytochrome P450
LRLKAHRRVEIDAILVEVLLRTNDLAFAAEPEWLPASFISGPKAMRVRFRAA